MTLCHKTIKNTSKFKIVSLSKNVIYTLCIDLVKEFHMTKEIYDITIIGGGPAGIFAAFYAGMRQAKTKIIESLPQLGGQLSLLYPEKLIYDVAGFPNIKAQQLVDQLVEQIKPFNQTICLDEEVLQIEKEDDMFKLITKKSTHYSKTVIIAAGNGAFQPKRLTTEGHEYYEGKGLHYFVTDMEQFRGKDIMICGGGDSAVDWALMLENVAKSVKLVHRRPTFRAHEHSISLLEQSSVEIETPFVIQELHGDGEHLTGVTLFNPKEDESKTIDVSDLLVNYGFSSSLGPIKNWPIELTRQSIVTDSATRTSVDGIFAIGDISTYDGKVELIATGFGEAPIAVNHAVNHINPKERIQPMHSTSLFDQ